MNIIKVIEHQIMTLHNAEKVVSIIAQALLKDIYFEVNYMMTVNAVYEIPHKKSGTVLTFKKDVHKPISVEDGSVIGIFPFIRFEIHCPNGTYGVTTIDADGKLGYVPECKRIHSDIIWESVLDYLKSLDIKMNTMSDIKQD